jgi:subtilisin family serine protease
MELSMAKSEPVGYSSGEFALPAAFTSYVVCEMRYDSPVAAAPAGGLASRPAHETQRDTIDQVLSHFRVKQIKPHFDVKAADLRDRLTAAAAVPAGVAFVPPTTKFTLAGYARIELKDPKQAAKLVAQLEKNPLVWKAFEAPKPEPAAARARRVKRGRPPGQGPIGNDTGSRNFEPSQGYLHSAPNGIAATDVWPQGATGKGVTICDIEGAWQLDHEDLPAKIPLIGGVMLNDLHWRNHGTAVLGEMVCLQKNIGCAGVSLQAKAVVQSAVIDGVFNAAGAIVNAAAKLSAGDVILIELHARGGPDDRYLAMQHWPDVFAAIRIAVAKGIVVVEAAGNGGENFDRPEYANDGLQKDAGAIVVGAGVPPTNFFDAYAFPGFAPYSRIGAPRSRIWFSNYGQIVNVQGWGWHVTTLGYGDAQGGKDEKSWYTLRFSGTSSASPIVTGAAACLLSYAKASTGNVLTPTRVRDILANTGTPQADDAPRAPLSQKIGPLPNLVRALEAVDGPA